MDLTHYLVEFHWAHYANQKSYHLLLLCIFVISLDIYCKYI